jgi:hypothetical protein
MEQLLMDSIGCQLDDKGLDKNRLRKSQTQQKSVAQVPKPTKIDCVSNEKDKAMCSTLFNCAVARIDRS